MRKSCTTKVSRVTPNVLWYHKGPKQLLVMAIKKGPFLSGPESLLRRANIVSAVLLLPVEAALPQLGAKFTSLASVVI